jgi:hypothetical protein
MNMRHKGSFLVRDYAPQPNDLPTSKAKGAATFWLSVYVVVEESP